jgi:hypothetical protein
MKTIEKGLKAIRLRAHRDAVGVGAVTRTSATTPIAENYCSIRGCARVASGANDSDGDLCGDHRAAEISLGRGPTQVVS